MLPRVIVLGWDSATYDIIDPMLATGRLPALARMIERGTRGDLRSTWPPMTDCAWTGAFTGRNAGAHGIFGSWYRAPGEYRCRYFSSRDRKAPALWELTDDVRHLVWNIPMTFPATAVEGVMVAGYGAPPGAPLSEPAPFADELTRRWSRDDLLDRAPHASLTGFHDDLVRGLEVQAEALPWAIERAEADCVVAVWPHVDRAQHFFWQFRGTDDPLSGAIEDVYEAMDRATGAVVDAFPDADVWVVSDHGAGPLRGDVNVGAWLVEHGYAVPAPPRGFRLSDAAWALPPAVRRLGRRLAPDLARQAMGARLAGQLGEFDWSKTRAFFGFHSDLWLNLKGREPEGIVDPGEADALLDEILAGLLEIRDPRTDEPVFAGAHKRRDVYAGPADDLAPDAILDTWSAGYRVAPARNPAGSVVTTPAPLAGVQVAWSSDHRPLGVSVAAGPRIASGSVAEHNLIDVCPTVLALLGQGVPDDLDGAPVTSLLDESFLAASPIKSTASTSTRDASSVFSDEEAAAVAEHLKDLGYIE